MSTEKADTEFRRHTAEITVLPNLSMIPGTSANAQEAMPEFPEVAMGSCLSR
jgi:hypothetical protein